MDGRFRVDLLRWGPTRGLLRWRWFPIGIQLLLVAVVVGLAINGFGVGEGYTAAELKTLRKTNLTTLVVWGLYWPGMIAVALAAGRIWCTVCPMELVHRTADALARVVGWPRARLPRLLRAGWITLALYLLMQVLVATIALHRLPHATAWLLVSLLGLAFASGLLFRHPRAFCTAFCPAAALLSVYGRFTPFQLDSRDGRVCDDCRSRDCVRADNRHRLDGRSCPSLLRPYRREASDGCVMCLQCSRSCPHDNVGLGLARPAAPVRRTRPLRAYEAGFALIATGFVAHEVFGEAPGLDPYFHHVPAWLGEALGWMPFRWWEGLWYLALFPALVWGTFLLIARLVRRRQSTGALLIAAATGAAPVIAVAHLAKALAKLAGWAPYLPGALADPAGHATFAALAGGALARPTPLVPLTPIGWFSLLCAVGIAVLSWRWVKELDPGTRGVARAALVVSALLMMGVIASWSAG